jgi:hypothetical protein
MPNKDFHSISASDIQINERGEVMVANADLAKRLQSATKEVGRLSAADNYVGCGGNAYQCGKALEISKGDEVFKDLVNHASNLKNNPS